MHYPTDRMTHTMAFVIPVMDHWLEREIAQWVHPMKDRSDDPSHHERRSYKRKEGNALFNDAVSILDLKLCGFRHMVTHTQIMREETCCHHFMSYSF